MKITVGGEYMLDSDKLISFSCYEDYDHKDDVLVYLGKYFLYNKSPILGEKTYEDAYIFYSEKHKDILYSIQRSNFILDAEFDYNEKFVNFKENKIFVNEKCLDFFSKEKHALHSIWIDVDDYLNNKEFVDEIYHQKAS